MPTVTLKDANRGLPTSLKIRGQGRQGGEATVYFTTDDRFAVKIYHRNVSNDREDALRKVRDLFHDLSADQAEFIVPPLALVDCFDGEPRVGFVMRRVSPKYRELAECILDPRQAVDYFRQDRSWADFLRIARCISNCIGVLHGKGCAHSDIHFRNFLVSLETGRAVMLEVDGVVVPGFLRPQVAGFMGFMAPEVVAGQGSPDVTTDRHSLAVLVLHTLLFRNVMNPLRDHAPDAEQSDKLGFGREAVFSEHPTERRNRPPNISIPLYQRGALSYRMLGPRLKKMTERALIEGLHDPPSRPLAREWVEALACAYDELYGCHRCRQQFIYPFWLHPSQRRICPFCGQRLASPGPAVIELYEEGAKGSFWSCDRRLILDDGFRLFGDVVAPAQIPPVSRQNTKVVATCARDRRSGHLILENQSDTVWTCRLADGQNGPRTAPGESLAIRPGVMVQCGTGARLMRVLEAP